MSRVTVALIGARRHYAVPRLLHEAGLLERFYTDSYIGNKPWLKAVLKAIPSPLRSRGVRRWLGRENSVLPRDKVTSFEGLGLWYAWARRRAHGAAELEAVYGEVGVRFGRRVIASGLPDGGILWGFNGASVEMFTAARAKGIRCILEQTSNPKPIQSRLTEEEYARWGDWDPNPAVARAPGILLEREQREWALADRIVAGSDFVADGLVQCGIARDKVRVVPYGIDLSRFGSPKASGPREGGPLRVLFVGRVSVMKGIPYLVQALAALGPTRVQARLIGGVAVDRRKLEPLQSFVTLMGHIPRSEVVNQYAWADVLCFPSITEGSAGVTYEALASGLPVITTPNAGSIITDGVDGFIVPIRDPDVLANALARYAGDRILLARHRAATVASRIRGGLDRYREDLARLVRELDES